MFLSTREARGTVGPDHGARRSLLLSGSVDIFKNIGSVHGDVLMVGARSAVEANFISPNKEASM